MADNDKKTRFEQCMLPHLRAAYALARWLSLDDQVAKDVMQEAYLRAFRFFDGFRGENARAWLLAIVRNTWLTQRHAARAHAEETYDETLHEAAVDEDLSTRSDPLLQLERASSGAYVRRVLAQLPAEFREILLLREVEELSYKEIAQTLAIPMGTVMSRLARARHLLARRLEAQLADL